MTKEQLIDSIKTDKEAIKTLTLEEIERFYLGLLAQVEQLEVIVGQDPKVPELEAKILELETKLASMHDLIKKLEEIIASYKVG